MNNDIVMILTNGFDPDPRVYKEAVYLVNKGFKVTVLCWDRDLSRNNPENEVKNGINVIRYKIPSVYGSGYKQISAYFTYLKCCYKYLHQNPPKYIHGNDLDGIIVGAMARRRASILVFDMHELYEDVGKGKNVKRYVMRVLTKHFIKKSQNALYENDLYLEKEYKRVQHKLLPLKNYPDSSLIIPKEKSVDSTFRVGYYGGLRSQIPQFKALFEAVKGMKDVKVYIRGAGPDYAELERISSEYENVFLGGHFDGVNELTELYKNTDVIYAGYRPDSDTRKCAEVVKFYESILTGTPIILTQEYTKMANIINNRGYGLCCDTLSIDDIKKSIEKLRDDISFRNTCHKNELRDSADYDWKNAVKVLDKIYI